MPVDILARLPPRLREFVRPTTSPDVRLRASILRRRRLIAKASRFVPFIWPLLIVAGLAYLVALPLDLLGRRHYVSENALQPGQVNTYWNWADVHIADKFADDVDKWSLLTPDRRANAIRDAFWTLGLPAATQDYSFTVNGATTALNGTNVYAILQAPKTDGAEALVLSASWLSRAVVDEDTQDRRVNTRGVAIVLALANYLKKYSMWSKDIIFLISDDYIAGSQAWLDSYHDYEQSNLKAEELTLTTGPIWAALNIDYPHHSFSHLGIFYEGVNGHLPNLDFINSASHIIKHIGVTPVLHDSLPSSFSLASKVPAFFKPYAVAATNLAHQIGIGALGKAPGPEATYGRYRIDAITLFAVPAEGPHGFHTLGTIVESIFRSLNNLLERFHQSFFLYLMKTIESFVSVGNYLAAPILISSGLTIRGLSLWESSRSPPSFGAALAPKVPAGSKTVELRREIARPAAVIAVTHLLGLGLFQLLVSTDPFAPVRMAVFATSVFVVLATPPLLSHLLVATPAPLLSPVAPPAQVLRSFTLILAGLAIAIVATLNFGGAVALSLLLPIPLIQPKLATLFNLPAVWAVWATIGGQGAAEAWLRDMLVDWHLVGSASLPFAWVVVVPLVMQSATASLL